MVVCFVQALCSHDMMLSSGANGRKKVGNCIFHSHSAAQVLPGMMTSEDWPGVVGHQCPPSLTSQQNYSRSASLSFSNYGFLIHYLYLLYSHLFYQSNFSNLYSDVDPVARMESFRALKLSRFESFWVLKS